VPFTLVSFHAHPDDEALLTAGTLARAAAEGHRVVLVCATHGESGLVASGLLGGASLAQVRAAELQRSAHAIGATRVEFLGYADSGMAGTATPSGWGTPFARADVEEAGQRLAAVLREEEADAVTIYDPAGGYGHPDHVQVHRVGTRAAAIAGTPVVLEATADRDLLRRALRVARWIRRVPTGSLPIGIEDGYTPRAGLTHRVDVSGYLDRKRAAMAAHVTQSSAPDRTLAAFLRWPGPIYRRAFRHEWFVEHGRTPASPLLDDIFATLRTGAAAR